MVEVGVEFKVMLFKKLKNGKYSFKERLVLNIINYEKVVNENFEISSFLFKNNIIELVFYEYIKGIFSDNWIIKEVVFYEMYKNLIDYEIIK